MQAVTALLIGLPLQPEETERDILDAKSQLFQRYFSLFMTLLNDCVNTPVTQQHSQHHQSSMEAGSGTESETTSLKGDMTPEQSVSVVSSTNQIVPHTTMLASLRHAARNLEQLIEKLRHLTVEAMSSLLAANIDCGLVHAIGLGYHGDLRVRSAFIEVLTRILQEGMEFETLNETVMADRYQELVKLVTMITDDGDLPIALALANVVHVQQLDELARVLVTLFDAKHLLYELSWKIFSKEVELAEAPTTLFRGNTLASKIMGCCFRIYGASYLHQLLRKFIGDVMEAENKSYEVDPSRVEVGEDLNDNIQNVLFLVQKGFDLIVRSHERFPQQLRSMCHCLYQVVNGRFANTGLGAVEMIVFLRFINPAIVSPYEHGLTDTPPDLRTKRGLMLVSKILQAIANQATFIKEQCLMPFNVFIQSRMDHARKFISNVTLSFGSAEGSGHSISFVSEAQVMALHRLLWSYQDELGQHMAVSPMYATLGRRLATLLAQLGPPPNKPAESSPPLGEVDGDALIYHVLITLKSHELKNHPFELVLDLTHTGTENRFRTDILQRWFVAFPSAITENLVACYVLNCNAWVRDYANFHRLNTLTPLKNCRKLVFLDNMSKISDYIDADQQRLPAATLALEEDLKIFPNALKLWHKDIKCTVKVGPTALQIVTLDRQKILGHSVVLNDIYYASEIEEVCLVDDNNITLTILNESSPLSLIHNDCEQMVTAIVQIRTRYELAQPEQSSLHSKIRAKDVPGTLLNMALLNLGSTDPSLRTAAYNLLCALAATFDFKLEDQLLETEGLLIPANNTIFIRVISERFSQNEPHLTLEFLEECIQGFRQSTNELKHLCLEYMTPWLGNLPRFSKQNDDQKRQKVLHILDKLITLTVEEIEMYPSVQAKVWGSMGKVTELLDVVLDGFLKRSIAGGFGSLQAEVMADTAVALASANMEFVAKNVINRMISVLNKTCVSPQPLLEEHVLWDDIAVLARYLLLLSFNNCLDVISHLPYLFHFVTVLVNAGPVSLRASIHGLVINIIHSLCTCSQPAFSEDTRRTLKGALTEFSLPKFYHLFGISQLSVKTVASAAFRLSPRLSLATQHIPLQQISGPSSSVISLVACCPPMGQNRKDLLNLTDLQTISDALIELLEACQKDLPGRDLVSEWSQIARSFALRYNSALQPRALVVFSCLSKSASDADLNLLLALLVQAVKRREEPNLISALIMALTRLHPLLPQNSTINRLLFWVAIIIFQLEDAQLYEHALALLERTLQTLDNNGAFEYDHLDKIMMDIRRPLEWEFKALDQQTGLSFRHNFHFAVVGYLLKGLRHESHSVVTCCVRLLHQLLYIVAKPTKRDRFEVTVESLPYLLALLPVSEEIRRRCHLHSVTLRALSMSGSSETLTIRAGVGDSSEWTQSSTATTPMGSEDPGSDKSQNMDQKRQLTRSTSLKGGGPRNYVTLDTIPPPPFPQGSVQLPRIHQLRLNYSSWKKKLVSQSLDDNQGSHSPPENSLNQEKRKTMPPSVARNHQSIFRSQSLPVKGGKEASSPTLLPSTNAETQTSPPYMTPKSSSESAPGAECDEDSITPKISISEENDPSDNMASVKAKARNKRQERKSTSKVERISVQENNVMLDPELLAGQDSQALVLTVLATLVRNMTGESESRILFEYLAEASVLFPKVFPVIHCLIDQRITQVLQLCHDPALVRAVLHIVANMVPGGEGDEPPIFPSEERSQQQHISFLQAYGFGGLWRFAGPFLSKSASQQAMTAEVCACLERLVGTLGDMPPLTPPPPSPRLPASPGSSRSSRLSGEFKPIGFK